MAKSKRRLELGEEAWTEYQQGRTRKKARTYYSQKGKYATSWRIRTKEKLVAYKGGKCERCGYDKPIPSVYDFHHIDPAKKDFGIGSYTVLRFERLKEEVDKCELLCRNCHAEVHHELNQQKRQDMKDAHDQWQRSRLEKKSCEQCGENFQPDKKSRKYCSVECSIMGRRKVNRPGKKDLVAMKKIMSMESIGRQFGVSGNTVKKWIQ